MTKDDLPRDFVELLASVRHKRARTVIDHILEHGQITTEELKDHYGYNHPPRAARDVREQGIPLRTVRVAGADGRRIAAYRFGDPADINTIMMRGRTAFAAGLKSTLIEKYGPRCHIYRTEFPERELQIDHRVPFGVAGDTADGPTDVDGYMLLCASANRAKSWSCEHCPNWQERDIETCRTCYWAYPEDHTHVATREIRRLDLIWSEDEVAEYETLRSEAGSTELPAFVKEVLRAHLPKSR